MVGQTHGRAKNYFAQHFKDKAIVFEAYLRLTGNSFDLIKIVNR